jgi:hypothetical protein
VDRDRNGRQIRLGSRHHAKAPPRRLPPAEGTTHQEDALMSTANATRPTARTLPPEDSGYVKQRLIEQVRELIDRVKEDNGERLENLACDVQDDLERIEHVDQLDRETRTRLHAAAAALREHVGSMAATSESIMQLTHTINSGWYDVDEPEAND